MSQTNEHQLPEEALRLVLNYRRDAPANEMVTLREIQRVSMRLPPSDQLPEREPDVQLSGFWYELQNEGGQVLYRQVIGNPIRTWVDLPDEEDPTRPVHHEYLPEEKTFTLLVPAFPDGAQVILFSSPLHRPSVASPVEPMWRITLAAGKER